MSRSVYFERQQLSIFVLGISSGFPWVLIGSVLSAWLADEGLSRSSIGLFGLIFICYSINFLWSPLVDAYRLPVLHRWLGRRRSWIFKGQTTTAIMALAMSMVTLPEHLYYLALFGFFTALASATQDIAIDAYRVDSIAQTDNTRLSAASAMATMGWWTGYGGLGALPFFLADQLSWPQIYLILSLIMGILSVLTCFLPEPQTDSEQRRQQAYHSLRQSKSQLSAWLTISFVEPFREFFQRNGVRLALQIILFLFLFKLGEAFLGRMSIVFYKEVGFSSVEIGTYSKLLNWWTTLLFAFLASLVNMRFGIYHGLLFGGIAMALSNLLFALIAWTGPVVELFALAVLIDGFTGAWSTVALVAFISQQCNKTFSATQYALMASIGSLGRTLLASSSGFVVDGLDGNWSVFFILTCCMVIPGLWLLSTLKSVVQGTHPESAGKH